MVLERTSRPPLPFPHVRNTSYGSHYSQAASTAHAITAALSNPYSYNQLYSPHYAQAYSQVSWPATNVHGYTLSSTYVPGSAVQGIQSNNSQTGDSLSGVRPPPPSNHHSSSSWYRPGDSRCTYQGCTFRGAHKSVEIHMMDRHLIYPPGWENRCQKSDWDADPSLKGKPIPIQGTTIILDTPEVLDAWIAERKRRWPSSTLVEQKKRQREEAIARGQISVDDPSLLGNKRRRTNESSTGAGHSRGRRGDGGRRGKARITDNGWGTRGGAVPATVITEGRPPPSNVPREAEANSEADDDDSPEVVSSKPPVTEATLPNPAGRDDEHANEHEAAASVSNTVTDTRNKSRRTFTSQQPKKPPRDPFASRPPLLRNLLLPEIRVTISNLSQAIRFLVDNNFLEGVEVRPGQADERLIEVIGEDIVNQGDTER